MSNAAVADLAEQYRCAMRMLHEEIGRFDEATWRIGYSRFLRPVGVAMHIVDCLDFYFRKGLAGDYAWGHRFGGGWWELGDERLPSPESVLEYARELEERIVAQFGALNDADLARPYATEDGPTTLLGHYVYALRHTMHHHGELAALAVHHGLDGGSWR